jgi:hypothetical protein
MLLCHSFAKLNARQFQDVPGCFCVSQSSKGGSTTAQMILSITTGMGCHGSAVMQVEGGAAE